MSLESAKQFLNKVQSDELFAIQLLDADSKESRLIIANNEGFNFTVDELSSAKSEKPKQFYSVYETKLTMNTAKACCPCMGCKEDAAFA